MRQPFKKPEDIRAKIIGLGEKSLRKSYYPALQEHVDKLERMHALVNEATDAFIILDLPHLHLKFFSSVIPRPP